MPSNKFNLEIELFLEHVAFGRQEAAKAILELNPDVLLMRGNFNDCAGRSFKQVTGLQYAVWSLDWHMWSMLINNIIEKFGEEQKKQIVHEQIIIELCKHGIDVEGPGIDNQEHRKSISWDFLIDALEEYKNNYQKWSEEQNKIHWNKKVGYAQLILPAHVIDEYSRLDRALYPTTKENIFKELYLPRTNCDSWKSITTSNGIAKLGTDYAWLRGLAVSRSPGFVFGVGSLRMYCHYELMTQDLEALRMLSDIRHQQRSNLILPSSFTKKLTTAVCKLRM